MFRDFMDEWEFRGGSRLKFLLPVLLVMVILAPLTIATVHISASVSEDPYRYGFRMSFTHQPNNCFFPGGANSLLEDRCVAGFTAGQKAAASRGHTSEYLH
ncbi:MAG: hypothetical protein WBZ36_27430 [Candidatus Nitrosopolaris sp.]